MKIKSALLECMFNFGSLCRGVNVLLEEDLSREEILGAKKHIKNTTLLTIKTLVECIDLLGIKIDEVDIANEEEDKPRNVFDPNDPGTPEEEKNDRD